MVKVYQFTLVMRVLYMFHRYGCTIILDMNVLVFSR